MTDDTQPPVALADLRLILRNTEKAASDLRSLREAVEDMATSLGRRLTAIEASQRVIEDRITTLEARALMHIFARLRAQIEEVPLRPRQINEAREHFEEIGPVAQYQTTGVALPRATDPYPDGMPIDP